MLPLLLALAACATAPPREPVPPGAAESGLEWVTIVAKGLE
jgi:hypothetical protein